MNIKNLTALCLTSIIALNATQALADSPVAKAVAYKSCATFPESMGFGEKPQHCMNHEGKSSISFLVRGENIVSIKKETLKANKLSLNGADISTNRVGDPAYELGSFPKTSEDGKNLIFDVEIKNTPFAQGQEISFIGTVDITTSEKLIKFSRDVDTSKEFEIKFGDYIVTNKKKLSVDGILGNALSGMLSSNEEDKLPIKVIGDLEALVALEMSDNGKEVKTSWSSWNNDTKTINFNKPTQPNVNLKLKYWDKLKKETVRLSF